MLENKTVPIDELDWIRTREDKTLLLEDETFGEKLNRKFTENPLVFIGATATMGALTYGLYSFGKGNRQQSQYAMRARVAFQTFTLFTLAYAMHKSGAASIFAKLKKTSKTPADETKNDVSTPQQ